MAHPLANYRMWASKEKINKKKIIWFLKVGTGFKQQFYQLKIYIYQVSIWKDAQHNKPFCVSVCACSVTCNSATPLGKCKLKSHKAHHLLSTKMVKKKWHQVVVRIHSNRCWHTAGGKACVSAHVPSVVRPQDYSPPGSSAHRDSPGKSTGVGCYSLCQRIFPTQGSNPQLLHLLQCRWTLYFWTTREAWWETFKKAQINWKTVKYTIL